MLSLLQIWTVNSIKLTVKQNAYICADMVCNNFDDLHKKSYRHAPIAAFDWHCIFLSPSCAADKQLALFCTEDDKTGTLYRLQVFFSVKFLMEEIIYLCFEWLWQKRAVRTHKSHSLLQLCENCLKESIFVFCCSYKWFLMMLTNGCKLWSYEANAHWCSNWILP